LGSQTSVDQVLLLFEAGENGGDSGYIVLGFLADAAFLPKVRKLILRQINPTKMRNFVTQFLSNLTSEFFHFVARKIEAFDFGNSHQSQYLPIVIISDTIMLQRNRSNARKSV
jgi:hypothetical protein